MNIENFWIVVVLTWLPSGLLGYALTLAHFQCHYAHMAREDRRVDLVFSLTCGIVGGPFSILTSFLLMTRNKHPWYGFLWWPLSEEEAKRWSNLR